MSIAHLFFFFATVSTYYLITGTGERGRNENVTACYRYLLCVRERNARSTGMCIYVISAQSMRWELKRVAAPLESKPSISYARKRGVPVADTYRTVLGPPQKKNGQGSTFRRGQTPLLLELSNDYGCVKCVCVCVYVCVRARVLVCVCLCLCVNKY
jgi:hypothetical protein